jgi:hypothetical protein
VAYRDFASETGGEAKFVVNDEVLTASTGGRPIHEPGKDDVVKLFCTTQLSRFFNFQ